MVGHNVGPKRKSSAQKDGPRRRLTKASPAAVFTNVERQLLERTTPESKQKLPRDLDFYVRSIARLGGYLDRTSDAAPGTTVIWRGLSRLADLVEGARIAETPTAETYVYLRASPEPYTSTP